MDKRSSKTLDHSTLLAIGAMLGGRSSAGPLVLSRRESMSSAVPRVRTCGVCAQEYGEGGEYCSAECCYKAQAAAAEKRKQESEAETNAAKRRRRQQEAAARQKRKRQKRHK